VTSEIPVRYSSPIGNPRISGWTPCPNKFRWLLENIARWRTECPEGAVLWVVVVSQFTTILRAVVAFFPDTESRTYHYPQILPAEDLYWFMREAVDNTPTQTRSQVDVDWSSSWRALWWCSRSCRDIGS